MEESIQLKIGKNRLSFSVTTNFYPMSRPLPNKRVYSKSCLTFSSGQWIESPKTQHNRTFHSSWMSPLGLVLMGGLDNPTSSEILTDDGKSSPAFKPKYSIW